jgi:hypothetical protein
LWPQPIHVTTWLQDLFKNRSLFVFGVAVAVVVYVDYGAKRLNPMSKQ